MKYSQAKPLIKSGDLLAWSHRGWNSFYNIQVQAVRFFTQSEYSHVGIAWVVGGRVLVIEAVTPKVRIYPLSKLGEFYWVPYSEPWTTNDEEVALSYVGTEYSKLEALAAFFHTSWKPAGMQCAKLVATLRSKGKFNVTPSHIVDTELHHGGALYKVEQ